jgi:hypothetical protein
MRTGKSTGNKLSVLTRTRDRRGIAVAHFNGERYASAGNPASATPEVQVVGRRRKWRRTFAASSCQST